MPGLPPPTGHVGAALVTKAAVDPQRSNRYLLVTPEGRFAWVDDPDLATAFASMREATRMAMRLPSTERAFGLPRDPELALARLH